MFDRAEMLLKWKNCTWHGAELENLLTKKVLYTYMSHFIVFFKHLIKNRKKNRVSGKYIICILLHYLLMRGTSQFDLNKDHDYELWYCSLMFDKFFFPCLHCPEI